MGFEGAPARSALLCGDAFHQSVRYNGALRHRLGVHAPFPAK